jgi:NTE family protein
LTHALDLAADQVYVLSTAAPCTLTERPRGARRILIHATRLLVGRRFAVEVLAIGARPGVTILPPPCPVDVQPTDCGRPGELMARR